MISKPIRITLFILLLLAGGTGLILVRLDNARLVRQIAAQQRMNQQAGRLREENQRLQELIDRAQTTDATTAGTTQTDLERARAEVAGLEERAQAARAQMTARQRTEAEALANNRDPNRGLARLDYFRDVGRATPANAFQTFVWAALKGDLDTTSGMIKIDDVAREAAVALVASLSEGDRAKFPTPEKLAALFFTDAFTTMSAAQITGTTTKDAGHATVEVRGLTDKVQKVPLQLGPNGWQIVVPPGLVRNLAGWAGVKAAPGGE